MKRIQRLLLCVLLCLAVLPVSASADTGPKPAVTITVVNAPAGDYYLDLLIQDPGDYPNIDPEDYDPTLLDGLRSWEREGWWPALLEGTDVPLFGDLTPGEDGTHRFTYHGLPRTFRIAVSSAQGAQATESSFTRTVFYTHLTYNWATNTITKATSTVGFYLTQFLSTLIPTLLVEGALLWLFGFRSRQDWLVFALVNLATQLGLHAALGSTMMATGGHYFYYLMILPLEAIVLVVEIVAYRILLQEHSTGRRVGYAVCANAASYAVGYLPLHLAVSFLAR